MSDQQKSGANSPSSTTGNSSQAAGSGSDTVSAAKISAGTSVGNVGQSPMPQSGSGAGSSGGTSGQSSTLASHTSKPMGGTGGTGASTTQASSGSGGGQGGQSRGGQSSSGQSAGGQSSGASGGGVMDQAKQMAGQASSVAGDMYDQAADWARDTYEQASDWASGSDSQGSRRAGRMGGRSMRGMRNAGSGVQRYVAENPVMVGLIGLATGLLIGALLPRTRHEDEAFGEWADEVREQGLRYAHEMAQRGREFVEESFSGDDPRFAQHESEFRAGGRGTADRH
jgi:ElaB/YqjD/DUF883 family membrane-anchored ribosome-binding protein